MSFASDLNKFSQRSERKIKKVVHKVIIDMGTRLVYRTPVGNPSIWQSPAPPGYVGGAARANWQYGFGVMPAEALNLFDASGSLTVAKITAGVKGSKAAGIHWIANNLPYIQRLENRWSTQAPQGMMKLTVLEYEDTVASIVREFS